MKMVEVSRDGQDNTVKLPGEFLQGEEKVYINEIGNAVVLIPCHDPWRTLLDSLNEFSDDFMEDRVQPEEQVRENIF
jgi:antitoxin VapB